MVFKNRGVLMRSSLVIALLCCLALPACRRLSDIISLAEAGDPEAQNRLGFMYDTGEGVPEDDSQALGWYMKAAEQGLDRAQYNVGGMYYKGEGTRQDKVEAALWFQQAAEQGFLQAQLKLGFMYWHGDGVSASNGQAAYWFEMAAEQGNAIARTALAQIKDAGYSPPGSLKP